MADIVMTDDGIEFDGASLERGPLGGAETAFLSLARALAGRGHRVRVFNRCAGEMKRDGVEWSPLTDAVPDRCDLYIANRSDKLLPLVDQARRAVFWIHNPAQYLLKYRYLWKLWRRRMPIVFSGAYHAATYPAWAPDGGRIVIPYGISNDFLSVTRDGHAPPPRAIFTSNPLRGLDWLLDLWQTKIRPACPAAELHLYSGALTYGAHGAAREAKMRPILAKAASMSAQGVVLRDPIHKSELARELAASRVLLYRGDPGETFCLAVGEAQATGLPAVVMDIGCVAERVVHGKTGYVTDDDAAFAASATELLTDDSRWRSQSAAALSMQREGTWDKAAAGFEKLVT
jgi:glycosyltransferase involved in cell wall biosynthesis